jgi:BA14K-like protein
MNAWKYLPIGMVALAFGLGTAEAAPAPAAAAKAVKADAGSAVEQVQWGRRRGWGPGPWIGLGAGVVVGTIIADQAYRPRRGYYYDDYAYDGPYYFPSGYRGDPRTICAQNFRSFDWNTGLYTTYNGERRLCPYLR